MKKYTVEGTAADGQKWKAEGEVADRLDWVLLADEALRAAFQQVTGGKAVFGKPGIGCRGPYKITRVEVKE